MHAHPRARRTLLSVLIAAIGMPSAPFAAQLSLAQYPAGSATRAPAPNVILSLDDSGSMGSSGTTGSGMRELKTALHAIFNATTQVIPDNSIRLGWNTFNQCQAVNSNIDGCNAVRVLNAAHRTKFLNWVGPATQASSGNQLRGSGSTPTHTAYAAAGNYIQNSLTTDADGVWAATPGATADPVLSCRRNYVIVMTDGEWNITPASRASGTTAPTATSTNLPDGVTRYDATSAETQLYRNPNATNYNKLADLTFHYWATDLNGDLTNNLKPLTKVSEDTPYRTGSGGTLRSVTLSPYWNPRNDPATWQHIQTYAIGFRDASEWTIRPTWAPSGDMYGDDGDFKSLVTGAVTWPNPGASNAAKRIELWAMALAGRGRFIPASDSTGLVAAFKDIFGEISADRSQPVTSFANASSSIAYSATTQYTSGYYADGWYGFVQADTVTQDSSTGGTTTTPDTTWGTKSASPPNLNTADKLNALAVTATGIANRLILSWRDLPTGGGPTSFEWAADESYLSTAQKNLLKESTATTTAANLLGQQRLDFIRGNRSLEGTTLRTRTSIQGDIVNSGLWYVADPVSNYGFDNYLAFARKHAKRLPMVYVGGNDGMLHGFSGVDGSEKIAYVPKGVIQNLPELTRSSYTHRYYVDGSPFSGDVFIPFGTSTDPEWRTLLFGTLGAGGKGYFVLDVTTPGSTVTGSTAVESNMLKAHAASLVVMDKTSAAGSTAEDADLGHIMVAPVLDDSNALKTTQIVRMNNGRWAAVMGNGYNSTNERPVLLIQYLDGAKELFKIVASSTTGTSNGLSAPRLVDLDGNGTPDLVYAGDLLGNLWKFDVSAANPLSWNVAFSTPAIDNLSGSTIRVFNGTPLYRAVYTSGGASKAQPITAPPVVRANERGATGLMVAFGTGRSLTEADRTDTSVQSVYSVLDNTRYKLVSGKVVIDDSVVTPAALGSGVTNLQQQTVSANSIAGSDSSSTRTFWTVSQNNVAYTGAGKKSGWYMNLPMSGERVLAQMYFYDESNNIELISEVPASGGGTAGETCAGTSTAVQKYRTLLNIMDGKRPSVQVMDTNGDGFYKATDGGTSRMTASAAENRVTTRASQIRIGKGSTTSTNTIDKLARLPEIPLRPNWRQLQ
jgi:type IV pilus assembly protein PilY1